VSKLIFVEGHKRSASSFMPSTAASVFPALSLTAVLALSLESSVEFCFSVFNLTDFTSLLFEVESFLGVESLLTLTSFLSDFLSRELEWEDECEDRWWLREESFDDVLCFEGSFADLDLESAGRSAEPANAIEEIGIIFGKSPGYHVLML
jgi:hypothetical protein